MESSFGLSLVLVILAIIHIVQAQDHKGIIFLTFLYYGCQNELPQLMMSLAIS